MPIKATRADRIVILDDKDIDAMCRLFDLVQRRYESAQKFYSVVSDACATEAVTAIQAVSRETIAEAPEED